MRKDPGYLETEELLKRMEGKVNQVYRQAARETDAKLQAYLKDFDRKDKEWKAKLERGEITKKQYDDWRIGQVMMGQRWEEMRDTLAEDFHNSNDIARSIVNGYEPDVYAVNHNYATFEVEKASKLDTSYTLYNRQAVERLMREKDILPGPGRKVKAEIAANKDLAWQKGQIQSVMAQSILQGESAYETARRISSTLATRNDAAAIRYARTATTAAQNAGRQDAYERAADMNIHMKKQWIATLDDRVRDSHAQLDGVVVDLDDEFPNGCRYPGDPSGDAAEVYNCRCCMNSVLEGFEIDASDLSLRDTSHMTQDSYEEWKEAHTKTG